MTTSSYVPSEMARKNLQNALRAISSIGQKPIAEEIRISETTLSNFVSQRPKEDSVHLHLLDRACQVLAAAGLKVVPSDVVCVSRRTHDAYKHLAAEHMRSVAREEHLSWDE